MGWREGTTGGREGKERGQGNYTLSCVGFRSMGFEGSSLQKRQCACEPCEWLGTGE